MSEIVADAAWCWFGDPRAVYYNGHIYYGWTDSKGWIWVAQVNTTTWTRRRAVIAEDTQVDDHNNPSILIRGGRVVVFWCGHQGPSMRYRVADNPDSVVGFGPALVCAAGNTPGSHGWTYPNVAHMGHDNAAYLVWRGGNFQPTWSKSTSVTGNAWSPAAHLFSAPHGQRPYLKMISDGSSRLHFLLTDAHPNVGPTSVYYVQWRLTDNTFRRADGTVVGTLAAGPIPVTSLERLYDGVANPRAWVWDVQLDSSGQPHAVFAVLVGKEQHEYWSARYGPGGWRVGRICDAGGSIAQNAERYYSGGIALDPLDPDVVAVSRPGGPQELHRIERWSTADDGLTWTFVEAVSDADQQNVRPFYVRGAPAGANWRLLWLAGTFGEYVRFSLRLVGARAG